MSDHGFISLGKFSSARDSMLHNLCLGEWSNESFGDFEWGSYHWRISLTEEEVNGSEFNSLFEGWLEYNPEVIDSPELRKEFIGHFVVTENQQGFVSVRQFDTEAEQLSAYGNEAKAFHDWLEADYED